MECTRWRKNQQAYLEVICKENKTDDVICLHFGVYGNTCGHMIPSSDDASSISVTVLPTLSSEHAINTYAYLRLFSICQIVQQLLFPSNKRKRHIFSMYLGNMISFFGTLLVFVCKLLYYLLTFKKICLSFQTERDLQRCT